MITFCLALIALLGHGYFWVDIINPLHGWAGWRKLIDGITFFCFVAFLALPLLIIWNWGELNLTSESSTSSGFSWLSGYFYFCVGWGIFRWLLSIVFWRASNYPRVLLQHRQEKSSHVDAQANDYYLGSLSQALAKVPGNQAVQLMVDHKRLVVPRLGKAHAGLKIAHISDLHMTGRIAPEWFYAMAEQINELQPDVIAITGDLIEDEACWPCLEETLRRLKCPCGIYFILGNHDYYLDTTQTCGRLEELGLVSLTSSVHETEWKDVPVVLAGNERPWNPSVVDFPAASSGDERAWALRVAMLHSPDQFPWACEQQADLALAGHTHGGQICFPLLGPVACPSLYGTRYARGVFKRGNTVMHVTRGISGKTPLRWCCPPEIALLELVKA